MFLFSFFNKTEKKNNKGIKKNRLCFHFVFNIQYLSSSNNTLSAKINKKIAEQQESGILTLAIITNSIINGYYQLYPNLQGLTKYNYKNSKCNLDPNLTKMRDEGLYFVYLQSLEKFKNIFKDSASLNQKWLLLNGKTKKLLWI